MASNKKQQKFEKLSDFINTVLGSMVNMHGEVKQLELEVKELIGQANFAIQSFQKRQETWEKRIKELEEYKSRQFLASKEQIKRIEKMEEDGFTLSDKTMLSHILGTNQLLFEEIGKISKTLSQMKTILGSFDTRITSVEMGQQVITQKLDELKGVTLRMHRESINIIYKLTRVVLLSVAGLVTLIGLGQLFDMFRTGW